MKSSYHYRILSADGNGNFISSDAIGVIADEIVKLFAIPVS